MPFDILNYLLNEFKKTEAQLTEQMKNVPGSVDNDEYQKFSGLLTSLEAANSLKNEMSEEAQLLDKTKANDAASAYNEFINLFEVYSKDSSAGRPEAANELIRNTGYTLFAVKAQAGYLEKASKLEENAPMPTMNDIMSDYSWIKDVFKKDPDAAEFRKEPETKWNAAEHSISENFVKYAESVKGLKASFLKHVSNVTGDPDDPLATFEGKAKLVQLAMDSASGFFGELLEFSNVVPLYQSLLQTFDVNNIKFMNADSLICGSLIEMFTMNKGFNETVMSGEVGKLKVSDENKKFFLDAVSKLKVKSYNLGIDSATMNILDETSAIFELINRSEESLITGNNGVDPYEAADDNSPIYGALKTAKEIKQKALRYIKGEEGAEPVCNQDIEDFLKALGEGCINSEPITEDGAANNNFINGMNCMRNFVQIFPKNEFPSFTSIYEDYVQKHQTIKKDYTEKIYNKITDPETDPEVYSDELEKIYNVRNSGVLDDGLVRRIEFYDICTDPERRNDLITDGNREQKVIASIVDYEYRCAEKFVECGKSLRGRLKNTFNHTFTKIFSGNGDMDKSDLGKLEKYYDSVSRSPIFQHLTAKTPLELDSLAKNGGCGKCYYEKRANVLAQLDDAAIDALTQTSGNMHSSNSEEYNAVGTALDKYASEVQRPEGASPKTCKALYEACTTYMYTHDSNPSTPNGKLRFNAAAAVMAKIIPEVLHKNPEMYGLVEKDVKINMIRSKSFRDEIVNNDIAQFGEMGRDIDKVLKSELGKNMISGKLPTDELKDALLKEFNKLDISHFKNPRRSSGTEISMPEEGTKASKDNSIHL